MKRAWLIAVPATSFALVACSFIIPFNDYDAEYSVLDGGSSGAPDGTNNNDGCVGAGCTDAAGDTGTPTCTETISSENCGACGHSCLGGACLLQRCPVEKVASAWFVDVTALSLDSNRVYGVGQIAGQGGGVGRVEKNEAAKGAVLLANNAPGRPYRVVVSGTDLYFTMKPPNVGGLGYTRTDGDGGSPIPEAGVPITGQAEPAAIVANATHIYWVNSLMGGDIWRADRGPPVGNANRIVPPTNALGLALDDTFIYWTVRGSEGTIMRAALDGSQQAKVVDTPWPLELAVDETSVYWTADPTSGTDGGGSVMKAPKAGGGPIVTLASGQTKPGVIVANKLDSYVYWTQKEGVVRVAKTGGAPLQLAPGDDNLDVAVDATHVYFVAKSGFFNEHEIRRVAK